MDAAIQTETVVAIIPKPAGEGCWGRYENEQGDLVVKWLSKDPK